MVKDNPERSRYELYLDGELAGFVTYRLDGAVLSMLHTEVDSRFEGRGLGSQLVAGALDAARAAGHSVLPHCPFIRGYITRHPEYADLVRISRLTDS